MENELRVYKSNKLIESRYKMTLQEMRLISYMIAQITQEDEDFKLYQIEIKTLQEHTNISESDVYSIADEVSERLMTKVIKIEDKKGSWSKYQWLNKAKYENGVLSVSFHPDLKPYLLQLKEQFKSYNLATLLSMTSTHAIRLYELLKQYETIGERTFTLQELREILGIKEDEYKLYADFKKRVIEVARRQHFEKARFVWDYKEIKRGRKVDKIVFYDYLDSDFLRNITAFKRYIRGVYVNVSLYHVPGKQDIAVSPKGHLYDKYQKEKIGKARSDEMWLKLFEMAKNGTLYALQ
jgi:plasmid replication initiation protein